MSEKIKGYLACKVCKQIKTVKEGTGKRSGILHARCGCGLSQPKKGSEAMAELAKCVSLDEANTQLDQIKTKSTPNNIPDDTKPNTPNDTLSNPIKWGICAALGLVGFVTVKAIKG